MVRAVRDVRQHRRLLPPGIILAKAKAALFHLRLRPARGPRDPDVLRAERQINEPCARVEVEGPLDHDRPAVCVARERDLQDGARLAHARRITPRVPDDAVVRAERERAVRHRLATDDPGGSVKPLADERLDGKRRPVRRRRRDRHGLLRQGGRTVHRLRILVAHRPAGQVDVHRAVPRPARRQARHLRRVQRPPADGRCGRRALHAVRIDRPHRVASEAGQRQFPVHKARLVRRHRPLRVAGRNAPALHRHLVARRIRHRVPHDRDGVRVVRRGDHVLRRQPRVEADVPDRLVQDAARRGARRLGLRPALYPDRHVRVVVVFEVAPGAPADPSRLSRRAGGREGEVRRIDGLRSVRRPHVQRLHRKRRAVPPHIGLLPFRRGFGMPAVVRDFDGLEGEEQRLLAIVRARRGVGVGDLDRRLAALRRGGGALDQRKSERVERAVGLHGLGPVAEIGVLRRVGVFIRRGIQALSAPDGIALAPHAELVVRPGAGVARQRHAVKERTRNAVVRGKPAQAAAVPPRVPLGRAARTGATVDGIVEVGRHVPPVDHPGVAVDGPAHAVPLEHDAPSVVRQRGRHVLRRRIRAGMIHRRERLPRRRRRDGKREECRN